MPSVSPPRCVAVSSLGLWVCEELTQNNIHHQVKDAINVLGVTLKVRGGAPLGPFLHSALHPHSWASILHEIGRASCRERV